MLECPKCQHDNDLGRIFCAKCGEKLEISKLGVPSSIKRQARKGRKVLPMGRLVAAFFGKVFKIVWLAAVSAVLISVWLPPRFERNLFSERDLASFQEKHTQLQEAATSQQAVSLVFTEAELNSALAAAVANTAKLNAGSNGPVLNSLYLSLGEDTASLIIESKWKWFRLALQGRVRVLHQEGILRFLPTEIRIGRLLVPPAAFPYLEMVFKRFLGDFSAERQWIEQSASFSVKQGQVSLTTTKGE